MKEPFQDKGVGEFGATQSTLDANRSKEKSDSMWRKLFEEKTKLTQEIETEGFSDSFYADIVFDENTKTWQVQSIKKLGGRYE